MLAIADMAFRVWHQGEDATGAVADTGDFRHRAVGVVRVTGLTVALPVGVVEGYIQAVYYGSIGDELTFTVGYRQVETLYPPGEDASALSLASSQ